MTASRWEFEHRALIFGLIFGAAFLLYAVDHENAAARLASWLGMRFNRDPYAVARGLFAGAALLLAAAALLRTWASAYLHASVVYAADVKAESLIADGPYRYVRNPLYLANVLMAAAMGAMMSRAGGALAVGAMLVFCYRLIGREESLLEANHGAGFERYCRAVPRLWPALRPRLAAGTTHAEWRAGFLAEFWMWGFAAALAAFAATLSIGWFYSVIGASLLAYWIGSRHAARR